MKERPSVEIRNTVIADVPKLRAMHAQSWRDTYPNDEHDISKEWVEEYTARWLTPEALENSKDYFTKIVEDPNQLHLVAMKDQDVVGMVHAVKTDNGQNVRALYVDKAYHGTGLAHALMQKMLDWCDISRPVDLEVVTYNERAKAFYRKYGFKEKPGTEELFVERIPIITMERKGENE